LLILLKFKTGSEIETKSRNVCTFQEINENPYSKQQARASGGDMLVPAACQRVCDATHSLAR